MYNEFHKGSFAAFKTVFQNVLFWQWFAEWYGWHYFSVFRQQDAQEFLRYLLEGLHEDVNRVTSKPKHIEIKDDDFSRYAIRKWQSLSTCIRPWEKKLFVPLSYLNPPSTKSFY